MDVAGTNPWDRVKQSRYKNVQLARRFIEDQTVRKRAGAVALAVHSVARMSSLRTRKAARESTSTEDIRKLAADARLGPTIQAVLDEDRLWDSYKAQDHDLFLAPDAERGLIAGTGGRVGLLTSQ